MFIMGLAIGGVSHYFYTWMGNIMPDRSMSTTRKKIILDQILMSPFCIIIFFYGMGLMESKKIPECTAEIKKKFLSVYMVHWL